MAKLYKLIVHAPLTHADAVRLAIGGAGGGQAGSYTHCAFTTRGIGYFKGNEHANPYVGQAGQLESVEEISIEVSHIPEHLVHAVITAMEAAHPYEETAYQLFEMVNLYTIPRN